jgi:putative ABC transport system substrate-binding protein
MAQRKMAARSMLTGGGLIFYGPDRIHTGARPATSTSSSRARSPKYEPVINLKTAKALGLEVPATVLTRADALQKAKVKRRS